MENLNLIDIWRDLGSKIKIFTKETSDDIPEKPGIYGWFLPLWIFENDLNSLLQLINSLYLYDSLKKGPTKGETDINFRWDRLKIIIEREYSRDIDDKYLIKKKWDESLKDEARKNEIASILMQSSIFLPPLYVGKAIDLKARYSQHVSGSGKYNSFRKRFLDHSNQIGLKLNINDLVFTCILTSSENISDDEDNLNFLENLIMKIVKPIFSEK